MPGPGHRFLDPDTLAAIGDLRLLARTVVEGFLAGEHPSPRPGPGVEFSQYRSYQPGDDPRRVDWTLFARTDRFYVRESEIEQDVTVRLVLDASASMAHRDGAASKFEYARRLAAALAYLVHRQGDRLALHLVQSGDGVEPLHLPPGRGLGRVLLPLERVEAAGRWPRGEELALQLANRRERELVVLISDLHQGGDEIVRAAELLRVSGHEVLVLELLGRNELEFDFAGDLELEDLETGETVRGHAATLRPGYLARLSEDLAARRWRLTGAGIGYELLRLDEPLDRALRRFLVGRGRL